MEADIRPLPQMASEFRLLGNLERVVHFDTEISDRTLELGMAE